MTQSMIEHSTKFISSNSNHNLHCEIRLFLTRQSPVGQGLLISKVSRSHTAKQHSR